MTINQTEYELWHKAPNATAWSKSAKPQPNIHAARSQARRIKQAFGFVSKCYRVTKEEIDL